MRHPSTPAERVVWIGHVLAHEGEYGVVSRLSREIGVSRQTLTHWRGWGRAVLEHAMTATGPTPLGSSLERSIVTLVVDGHASYRGIQGCLKELLGQRVSLGTIAGVVADAGQRAAVALSQTAPPAPVALALDEIFGGAARHGYLHAVDARSGVVWAAAGPVVPAVAVWQELLEGLANRGVRWSSAVHDGGRPAAGGVAAVTPEIPRQRDIWHLLHRCAQAQARIERLALAAEQKWEAAERYAAAMTAGGKPRYRPPAVSAAAQAAVVDTLAQTATNLRLLTGELQRLVEVVVVEGDRVLDAAARAVEVATVLAVLDDLVHTAPAIAQPEIASLHRALVEAHDGFLVFAAELDPVHADLAVRLGAEGVALVGWAWLRRAILGEGEALVEQFPASWRQAVRVLLTAWTGAVRASSAVEGWHSVLRPHLAVHRELSPALLALLALAHNHRAAPRGLHAGQSPLQRSGITEEADDWLRLLDYPNARDTAPTSRWARHDDRIPA